MYLLSRKYLLNLFFEFLCFFQIACVCCLQTHLTSGCILCKACFPVILHSLEHGTFGLLFATDFGIGIQLFSLDLQYRFQVQNGSNGSRCRCDPSALFQIFQGIQCDIDTGIEFLVCKYLLDLCCALSCLSKHPGIHYRLSLCYGNPLIVHNLHTSVIINSKARRSRTGCAQST